MFMTGVMIFDNGRLLDYNKYTQGNNSQRHVNDLPYPCRTHTNSIINTSHSLVYIDNPWQLVLIVETATDLMHDNVFYRNETTRGLGEFENGSLGGK